jgi:hypothetical protein
MKLSNMKLAKKPSIREKPAELLGTGHQCKDGSFCQASLVFGWRNITGLFGDPFFVAYSIPLGC